MRALHFGLRVCRPRPIPRLLPSGRLRGGGRCARHRHRPPHMLKLPGDDFVTLELVCHPDFAPTDGDSPLSHFVIQVDDMEATR